MTITRLRPSFTFTEERLAELRAVVPEAFADRRVNWEALKEALGEWTEAESGDAEHFGLFWPGKREARRLAAKPSRGTLVPVPGEGTDEETTRNLFIEGDNLEVLKLLQKSYAGRVKMIYIDPPYNTGNDFVYNDDFRDPLGDYLRKTGQVDEKGEALTTNTRADGRFHSNWLSMIYPRLRLARTLLADDGVIFVSIDDTEVANLRLLLNEVFGEENFVESFIWKKSYGGGAKEKYAVRQHEYILMYSRAKDALHGLWLPPDEAAEAKYYKYKDKRYAERGPFRLKPLEATKSMDPRPNLRFGIPAPDGTVIKPKRQWWWSEERVKAALAADELVFTKTKNGITISYKQYLRDEEGRARRAKPFSVFDGPYTQSGTQDLANLFEGQAPLQFPKPLDLLSKLISIGCGDSTDALIVDFFAGSGTLGHAVWQFNRDAGTKHRFVCVQLPEETEGPFETVAAISKERLRRASHNLKREDSENRLTDVGFRVLRLDSSNFRAWQDYDGDDIEQLEALFEGAETPLVKGWTSDSLLTEVLLLQGFPLEARIEAQTALTENDVRLVTADHVGHRLWVCLDRKIHDATVAGLDPAAEDVIVCLDSALNDEAKLRLADRCMLETI